MKPNHDCREIDCRDIEQPELGPDEVVEVAEGRFSVLCPRHGVEAELRIETVSGSVRSFSCSVPGEEGEARR